MLGVMSFSADELPPLAPLAPESRPGGWAAWTVWPPCLLTIPVFGLYILGAFEHPAPLRLRSEVPAVDHMIRRRGWPGWAITRGGRRPGRLVLR